MRSFREWYQHKFREPGPVVPQADKVLGLIVQSGRHGISRGKLGAAITLERETLDSVIQALVDFGRVSVSMENGRRIYRPR
jgi:hypothetical protein